MASRRDLHRLKLMHGIRQVRRADAEQQMAGARRSREVAEQAVERCRDQTEQASAEWREHLAAGAFDPLFSRGFADQIMLRVSDEQLAQGRAEAAARVVERSEQGWRQRQAETLASELGLKQAAQRHERVREERRTEALADRITYQWVKP